MSDEQQLYRRAGEVLEEEAMRRLGRDMGTVHRDEIAAAVIEAVRADIAAEAWDEAINHVQNCLFKSEYRAAMSDNPYSTPTPSSVHPDQQEKS